MTRSREPQLCATALPPSHFFFSFRPQFIQSFIFFLPRKRIQTASSFVNCPSTTTTILCIYFVDQKWWWSSSSVGSRIRKEDMGGKNHSASAGNGWGLYISHHTIALDYYSAVTRRWCVFSFVVQAPPTFDKSSALVLHPPQPNEKKTFGAVACCCHSRSSRETRVVPLPSDRQPPRYQTNHRLKPWCIRRPVDTNSRCTQRQFQPESR